MISTFGGFSMAKLGIRSSQQGLQITGNNITNINTDGYTRQRINQISLRGGTADRFAVSTDIRIGMGSLVTSVTQIRDPFLDIRYRNEASNLGFYDEKMGNLEELKSILDEVSKDGVHTAFESIRTQLQNLANNPKSDVNDRLVRSACQELVSLLNKYAADLNTQKETALKGFDQNVDQVNKMLTQISDLNSEIRKSQIHGDNALELIDRRNMLIDQLSEMTKIKVTYSDEKIAEGIVVDRVKIELDAPGQNPADRPVLIDGEFANKLEIQPTGADGKPDPTQENYEIHLGGLTNAQGDTPLLAEIKEQMNSLNGLTSSLQNTNKQLADVNKQLADWKAKLAAIPNGWNETAFTNKAEREQAIKGLQGEIDKAREDLKNATADKKDEALKKLREAESKLSSFNKLASERDALGKQQDKLTEQFSGQFESLKAALKNQGLTVTPDKPTPGPDGTYTITVEGGDPKLGAPVTLIDGNNLNNAPPKFGAELKQDGTADFTLNNQPFKTATKQDLDTAAHKKEPVEEKQWYGVLKADLEYLNGKGEFDPDGATKVRGLAYYQRSLDTLAQTFAETMNKLNKPDPNDPNSKADLFDSGNPPDKNITASNISISKGWLDGSVKITTSTTPNAPSGDNTNVLNMIQALNGKHDFIALDKDGNPIQDQDPADPNQKVDRKFFTGSFEDMFTNMNSVLGSDMSSTSTMLNNAAIATNDRAVARDNVSSVDLNEEGINLVQYQKSFQAACRVMTTLDEMLQSILNIGVGG